MFGRTRVTRLLPLLLAFLVLGPLAARTDGPSTRIQPPGIVTSQEDSVISYVRIYADDRFLTRAFPDIDRENNSWVRRE